ncbi:MAG: hypothetical protein VKK04_08065 [Synechococcales bacterium]|nr:hypothetical protein [Synechococcales bacterium]
MLRSTVFIESGIAQVPAPESPSGDRTVPMMMGLSGLLLVALAAVVVMARMKIQTLEKEKRFEEYKNRELQKRLKLSLQTITKMERNPDLIYSREFNLDYLRLRMEEEQFQFAIVNQIKIKVKEKISVALRPGQASEGTVGIASTGRKVDEVFDVHYDLSDKVGGKKGVLFRVQIKLTKIPTQATSMTVQQIVECLTSYMSPTTDHSTWQPTIQGRIASIHWDQKAKPTPLLVLEQLNEGVNVTFRTQRMARA